MGHSRASFAAVAIAVLGSIALLPGAEPAPWAEQTDAETALTDPGGAAIPEDDRQLINLLDDASSTPQLRPDSRSLTSFYDDTANEESGFDPAQVTRGQAAFNTGCLDCHDAQRSLAKSKSYSAWLATVRRMASKDGANVPASDHVPIATYLASLSGGPRGLTDMAQDATGEAGNALSISATISTLWRLPEDEHGLESPDFFPDVWLTASWQPDGPVSATITSCTSCHSDGGFTLELVEGSATLDLKRVFCRESRQGSKDRFSGWEAKIKAGRFVVPFGAFAAMSHPGVYRTLTNPLIYDMGRDFSFIAGGLTPVIPVLMMPFSDEGVQFSSKIPIWEDISATFDVYGVNGLRDPSISFYSSRSYRDNNKEPAVGGRLTVGSQVLRLGASVMYGDASVSNYYKLGGVDATARLGDILRLYAEYAFREHDSFTPGAEDYFDGYVVEAELYLCHDPGLSILMRYDTLEVDYASGGLTSGKVERLTTGLNIGLPGGSVLLLHHEHWNPDPGVGEMDLVGARWTCTF